MMTEIMNYIAAILMWNFCILSEKARNITFEPYFKRYVCRNSLQKAQSLRSRDTNARDGWSLGLVRTFLYSHHSGLF